MSERDYNLGTDNPWGPRQPLIGGGEAVHPKPRPG
jgi:hypothetical protein